MSTWRHLIVDRFWRFRSTRRTCNYHTKYTTVSLHWNSSSGHQLWRTYLSMYHETIDCDIQSGPIKVRTLRVLFIQNHALINSVSKLSENLYTVSSNVFTCPTLSTSPRRRYWAIPFLLKRYKIFCHSAVRLITRLSTWSYSLFGDRKHVVE